MKIGQVIERVQSLYSKGAASDDTRLEPRLIYNKIISTRAMLLSQISNKRQRIDDMSYQTLNCIELVPTNVYPESCIPRPSGCITLKSKYPIPNIVSGHNGLLVSYVTNLDGTGIYNRLNFSRVKYRLGARYTKNHYNFIIGDDSYLYVTSNSSGRLVNMRAVAEDPFEFTQFKSYCDEYNCPECVTPMEIDIHLSAKNVDTLVQLIVQELVEIFYKSQEDKTNNGSDSIVENSK